MRRPLSALSASLRVLPRCRSLIAGIAAGPPLPTTMSRPEKRARLAGPEEPVAVCYMCLEGPGRRTRSGSFQLLRCCACRGTAGFGHLHCFIQAAAFNEASWEQCPTCQTEFTGVLQLGLARAHWERVRRLEPTSEERQNGAEHYAAALQDHGNYREAMDLCRHIASVDRQVLGDDDPVTLESMARLGSLLRHTGDCEGAESLIRQWYSKSRETFGPEDSDTLAAAQSLGALLIEQGKFDEALPLLIEAEATATRTLAGDEEDPSGWELGPEGPVTRGLTYTLATLYSPLRPI